VRPTVKPFSISPPKKTTSFIAKNPRDRGPARVFRRNPLFHKVFAGLHHRASLHGRFLLKQRRQKERENRYRRSAKQMDGQLRTKQGVIFRKLPQHLKWELEAEEKAQQEALDGQMHKQSTKWSAPSNRRALSHKAQPIPFARGAYKF
jgi:hypothetical protein